MDTSVIALPEFDCKNNKSNKASLFPFVDTSVIALPEIDCKYNKSNKSSLFPFVFQKGKIH